MTQVGSVETLRKTDKIYAATNRYILNEGDWRGAYRRDRILGEVPVPLKSTMTQDGPTIHLVTADDFELDTPTAVQLRLRLSEWVRGDELKILFNGKEMTDADIAYCVAVDPHQLGASAVGSFGPDVWVRFDLDAKDVPAGEHEVKVVLIKRHPQVASDLVLTDVELVVTY